MYSLDTRTERERERAGEAERSPCRYLVFSLTKLNANTEWGERGAWKRDLVLGQLFIAGVGRQANLGAS